MANMARKSSLAAWGGPGPSIAPSFVGSNGDTWTLTASTESSVVNIVAAVPTTDTWTLTVTSEGAASGQLQYYSELGVLALPWSKEGQPVDKPPPAFQVLPVNDTWNLTWTEGDVD